MSDEQDPPRRKRSHWGDDERDAVGRGHRTRTVTTPRGYAEPHVTEQQLSDLEDADQSDGTPEEHADLPSDAELTGPSDLVLSDALGRELYKTIEHVARRGVQRHRNTSDLISQVHADAGNQHVGARVSRIEKQLKWWQGVALSALVAAAGSLIAVGKGLYERGEHEGRDGMRLEQVEHGVEQQRLDLRDLRRLFDERTRRYFDNAPTGASWSFPEPLPTAAAMGPAPKGPKP